MTWTRQQRHHEKARKAAEQASRRTEVTHRNPWPLPPIIPPRFGITDKDLTHWPEDPCCILCERQIHKGLHFDTAGNAWHEHCYRNTYRDEVRP